MFDPYIQDSRHTGIPPLKWKRESKALRQITKARALGDQPRYSRIQTPCSGRRKRSSFVRDAKNVRQTLKTNYHGRWNQFIQPHLNHHGMIGLKVSSTFTLQMGSKSDCNSDMQRKLTLEMLHHQYPHEA